MKSQKTLYSTWQLAGEAAQQLGINSMFEYQKNFTLDPLLPMKPERYFENFPGYDAFLGKTYRTWQEASYFVCEFGITLEEDFENLYEGLRKQNLLLPSNRKLAYSDYPGDEIFFSHYRGKSWNEFLSTPFPPSSGKYFKGFEEAKEYVKKR